MTIVFPISNSDFKFFARLKKSLSAYPPGKGHHALIAISPKLTCHLKDIKESLNPFFEKVEEYIIPYDCNLGWPRACNYFFYNISYYLSTVLKESDFWLWHELDCQPLEFGWASKLENEYIQSKVEDPNVLYMGVKNRTVSSVNGELLPEEKAGIHMAPCGIYPAKAFQKIGVMNSILSIDKPWYNHIQWYVIKKMHETNLIQNNWRTKNYRKTEGGIISDSWVNWSWDIHFNKPLSKSAVLLHGVKDDSLLELGENRGRYSKKNSLFEESLVK